MHPGMSASQARDYAGILKVHLVPYFGQMPLSEFRPVLMKKFLAHLKTKKPPEGNPLSPVAFAINSFHLEILKSP
jgi:hypothetical protein